ncbi:hypothetical protein CEXT_606551 [Caerostris extrusa]|uniref:Ycf15 n=1 Tax=Caerostris extrusa TaxID=172846 RepID=A0AAV4QVZ1_CAEEX|nr:hypothetical protein CEXT_606551 [Caerostris extrusa]
MMKSLNPLFGTMKCFHLFSEGGKIQLFETQNGSGILLLIYLHLRIHPFSDHLSSTQLDNASAGVTGTSSLPGSTLLSPQHGMKKIGIKFCTPVVH